MLAHVFRALADFEIDARVENEDICTIQEAITYAFRFQRLLGYQDSAVLNLYGLMTPSQRGAFHFSSWYLGHAAAALAHGPSNPIMVDLADDAESLASFSTHDSMPSLETQVFSLVAVSEADGGVDEEPNTDGLYIVPDLSGGAAAVFMNGMIYA